MKVKKVLKQQILIISITIFLFLIGGLVNFINFDKGGEQGAFLLVAIGVIYGIGLFIMLAITVFNGLYSIFQSFKLYRLMKVAQQKESTQLNPKQLIFIAVLGVLEFVVPLILYTNNYPGR